MMAAERAKHKKKWIHFITRVVSTSVAVSGFFIVGGGAQNKDKMNLLKAEKVQFAWLRAISSFRLLLWWGEAAGDIILKQSSIKRHLETGVLSHVGLRPSSVVTSAQMWSLLSLITPVCFTNNANWVSRDTFWGGLVCLPLPLLEAGIKSANAEGRNNGGAGNEG